VVLDVPTRFPTLIGASALLLRNCFHISAVSNERRAIQNDRGYMRRGKSRELILAGGYFCPFPISWQPGEKISVETWEGSPYTCCVMASWCRKCVAAFVLLWALADLTVPGLCQADDNRIDSADSALLISPDTKPLLTLSATGIPTSDQDGSPDECFCCSPYTSPLQINRTVLPWSYPPSC
jgi:hypothetical protein